MHLILDRTEVFFFNHFFHVQELYYLFDPGASPLPCTPRDKLDLVGFTIFT